MTSHQGKNFKVKIYIYVCVCVYTVYLGPSSKGPNLCSLLHICSLYKWVSGCRVRFRRKESFHCQNMVKNVFLNIYQNDQPRKCFNFFLSKSYRFFLWKQIHKQLCTFKVLKKIFNEKLSTVYESRGYSIVSTYTFII